MSKHTVGSFEVTIRIRLNQDITLQEARKFIQEMDYQIIDTTGNVSITETEVVSDNIGMDDLED